MLTGLVALAHRILLPLSGFLTATLLLLIRTLAGLLILLARILVLLLRHCGKLPYWTSEPDNDRPLFWLPGNPGSSP
jgi:hypothetical protein